MIPKQLFFLMSNKCLFASYSERLFYFYICINNMKNVLASRKDNKNNFYGVHNIEMLIVYVLIITIIFSWCKHFGFYPHEKTW